MLLGMVLMFVLETGILVALAVWLGRRVVLHLKENPAAVSALSEHLWMPLLGKKQ